jgi:hypothetical protein
MFRGPDTGDGARQYDYSDVLPLFGSAEPGPARPGIGTPGPGYNGRAWNGGGGRWLLWPLRAVLWATLLIVAYRGVTAIFFGTLSPAGAGSPAASGAGGSQFPVGMAEAYAAEFGQVYLNASPADQAQREQQLAAFVPATLAAAHPDLGWSGTGSLSLQSEQVAGISVTDAQHAVVTLLATVNGQLMELGVPVVASGGGIVVAGEPAWLPAPQQATLPTAASPASDPVARSALLAELPGFFQAYASGNGAALSQFELSGIPLTGLGGEVSFGSITGLQVPPGGSTRQITATVIWQLPAGASGVAKLEMAYRMSVVDLQSGKWYVKEISAATEAVAAK